MNQMMKEYIDKLNDIKKITDEDLLIDSLYEFTDIMEQIEGAEEILPAMFHFIEDMSHMDIGSPGPLVHYIEKFFPDYCDYLIVSVQRKPTNLTLWMCNRILNADIEEQRRNDFLFIRREN